MNMSMFGMCIAGIGGAVALFPIVGASMNNAPVLPFGWVITGIGVVIGLIGLATAASAK